MLHPMHTLFMTHGASEVFPSSGISRLGGSKPIKAALAAIVRPKNARVIGSNALPSISTEKPKQMLMFKKSLPAWLKKASKDRSDDELIKGGTVLSSLKAALSVGQALTRVNEVILINSSAATVPLDSDIVSATISSKKGINFFEKFLFRHNGTASTDTDTADAIIDMLDKSINLQSTVTEALEASGALADPAAPDAVSISAIGSTNGSEEALPTQCDWSDLAWRFKADYMVRFLNYIEDKYVAAGPAPNAGVIAALREVATVVDLKRRVDRVPTTHILAELDCEAREAAAIESAAILANRSKKAPNKLVKAFTAAGTAISSKLDARRTKAEARRNDATSNAAMASFILSLDAPAKKPNKVTKLISQAKAHMAEAKAERVANANLAEFALSLDAPTAAKPRRNVATNLRKGGEKVKSRVRALAAALPMGKKKTEGWSKLASPVPAPVTKTSIYNTDDSDAGSFRIHAVRSLVF